VWKREKRRKRRQGSVRFACMQDLFEGRTLKHVGPRSVHIRYCIYLPGYDDCPTTGAALHGKGRTTPLMPDHIPWTRDALDSTEATVRCINLSSGLGAGEYLVASLRLDVFSVNCQTGQQEKGDVDASWWRLVLLRACGICNVRLCAWRLTRSAVQPA
jgi:hypothetical protein